MADKPVSAVFQPGPKLNPEGCGSCALCCKLLHIDPEPESNFPEKAWNQWCTHCAPGYMKGACQIYDTRPQACKVFECIWLQSQRREDVPNMPRKLKPDITHVVLGGSYIDDMVLFAYVDPAYLGAWRGEPMRSYLIWASEQGVTVVIVQTNERYIMTKGRPTFKLTEGQVQELADGKQIRLNEDGQMQIGVPTH